MNAIRRYEGGVIPYTPTVAVAAGTLVVIGVLAGVAPYDIPKDGTGTLQISGVFEVEKTAAEISQGARLYFDGTAVTASADNGKTEGEKVEYPPVGVAVSAAAAEDATVLVKLN